MIVPGADTENLWYIYIHVVFALCVRTFTHSISLSLFLCVCVINSMVRFFFISFHSLFALNIARYQKHFRTKNLNNGYILIFIIINASWDGVVGWCCWCCIWFCLRIQDTTNSAYSETTKCLTLPFFFSSSSTSFFCCCSLS